MSTPPPAPRGRMLMRGLTKRCPRCGTGKLFRKWFSMVPDCPGCGLHFEREQGYWTGAIAINTIIVGGLFAVIMAVTIITTQPDIPWVSVLMLVVPIMGIVPLLAYPFTKTIWLAIDLAFLQPLGVKWDEGR
jgi:uncharacterized protein (DUF983 family)